MDRPFSYNKSLSLLQTINNSFILIEKKENLIIFSNEKMTLHFYHRIILNKNYLIPFFEEFHAKKRKLVDVNILRISPLYSNETSFLFVTNSSNTCIFISF